MMGGILETRDHQYTFEFSGEGSGVLNLIKVLLQARTVEGETGGEEVVRGSSGLSPEDCQGCRPG